MTTDLYQTWRDSLAGKPVQVLEDAPAAGFWKFKRAGEWRAVAIWLQGEQLVAKQAHGDMVDPHALWLGAARNPISEAEYRHVDIHGAWPGLEAAIGHNQGPVSLAEEVAQSVADLSAWLAAQPTDGEVDDVTENMAANKRTALTKLAKQVEAEHETRKRPVLEQGRAIDAEYKPLLRQIEDATKSLRTRLGRWLAAREDRQLREARAEAARKAEEARKAAEVQRQAASPSEPPAPAPESVVPASAPKVRAGGALGPRVGLKTVKRAVITDYAAALAHFADHEKVRAVVEQLCQHAARDGHPAPGCQITEERIAS